MKSVIFLVSGNGGNLMFINKIINLLPELQLTIASTIADRDCDALKYCESHYIPWHKIYYTKINCIELQNILDLYNPDFIITNWNKILDPATVSKYKGKLINLHYSLLPAFNGMIGDLPVKQAINKGCKFIGTTVHFVNENVDDGKIIGQTSLQIDNIEGDFSTIMNKIFQDGAINLLNSLLEISFNFRDKINNKQYLNNDICISPSLNFNTSCLNQSFWNNLGK